jgi:predicted nucleotidyltransferase
MNRNSRELSTKIDSIVLQAIEEITTVANSLGIPFFLVGAIARDILLEYLYDIISYRATLDLDFGIQVSNWNQYLKLKRGLIKTGKFTEMKELHRLLYLNELQVDLIPFGLIAGQENNIELSPDGDVVMSVSGFKESFQSSQVVRLRSDPILEIKIATLAGLAVMKLISWHEKYPERQKDANDLKVIMRSYSYAGNFERIFDELSDLIEAERFDHVSAGARLLGRDVSKIIPNELKEKILTILDEETGEQDRYRLLEDMVRTEPLNSGAFENLRSLLEEMKKGIFEYV